MKDSSPYQQTQKWATSSNSQRRLATSGQRTPMRTSSQHASLEQQARKTYLPALLSLLGIVPALVIGLSAFTVGRQMLSDPPEENLEPAALTEWKLLQQRQQQSLVYLLLGAVAIAGISGGLAIALLRRYTQQIEDTAAQNQDEKVAQSSRSLAEFSQRLRSKTKHQDILDLGVEQTRQMLDVERVVIVGLESQTAGSILAESVLSGYPQTLNNDVKDPCFADRYSPQTPNSVKIIDDIEFAGLPQCYVDFLIPLQVKASLSVLVEHQGTFGLLIAHSCEAPRSWSPTEVELFANIATQIGLALDQATIIAEEETLAQNLQEEVQWKNYMTDVTQYIHDSLKVEEILHVAVQEIRRVLNSDRVVVYSVDNQAQGVIIAESVAPRTQRILGQTIKDPCFEERYIQAYADGRVRAINDIRHARMTPCYIEQLEKIGVQANLVAPVIHECKLLGLLVAHQCSAPREWRDLEIRWFTQMSVQVGYALDNAKLISRLEELSKESEELRKERQTLDLQQLKTKQKLQTSQSALSDILSDTIQKVQDLTETTQNLELSLTEMHPSDHLFQSLKLQLSQMKSLLGQETESIRQSVEHLVSLEDNILGLSQCSTSLQSATDDLSQELSRIADLSIQINKIAENADSWLEQGAASPIPLQVLSLTKKIREGAEILGPLTNKVISASSGTSQHVETGMEQIADSRALAQETQQRLYKIEAAAEELSHLILKFDDNASKLQPKVGNTDQSLQETLQAIKGILQQMETLKTGLLLDPQEAPQDVV